jgi:hypothetical protein
MSTITLHLPAEKADRLTREAERMGVQVEQLLERMADEYLAREEAFADASNYVLKKNAELYRRLAK